MSSCRQNANIFWYLFKHPIWLRKRRIFSDPYFWQDSFLTHFNRLIGCKIWGHRNIQILKDVGENNVKKYRYCFNCYREING